MIDAIRIAAGGSGSSRGTGRHALGGAATIPVSVFLPAAAGVHCSPSHAAALCVQRPRRRVDPAARSQVSSVLAMTTVGALAAGTLGAPASVHPAVAMSAHAAAHVRATADADVRLAGVIQPSDVLAVVGALEGAMSTATASVASLLGSPAQTAADALKAAAFVSNVFFGLLESASPSAALSATLSGLKTVSVNGLNRLATTVWSLNSDMVLTTNQLSTLLTTALTGSLGTVVSAVTDVLNNPMSLPRYAGLAEAPLDVAGLALSSGISALNALGVNAFSAGNAVVTGVLSQINTVIDGIDGLFGVGHTMMPNAVMGGLLVAVHGIVMSPVNALLGGATGLSTAVSNVGADVVSALAETAAADAHLWVGDGTYAGALQRAIDSIAAAPLAVSSYTNALSSVVTAAIATVTTTVEVGVQKLATIPFTFAGDLSTAGGSAINAFITGAARVVAGLLQAAGVPSLLSNVSYGVAQAAIWVNNHIASGIKYELDTMATHVAQALGASTTAMGSQTPGAATASVSAAVSSANSVAASAAPTPSPATPKAAVRPPRIHAPAGSAASGTESDDATSAGESPATTDGGAMTDAPAKSKGPHKSGKPGRHAAGSTSSAAGGAQTGRHHKS